MRMPPFDFLQDIVAMIEIELSYAAAEIRISNHAGEELGRALEHIASAAALLRKLAAHMAEPAACEA